jgi:hypothetical protein
MIDIISVYQDAARDNVNKDENGYFGYEMFNRLSRRAELRLLDWLTGDVSGVTPPANFITVKSKDLVSPFITRFTTNVSGGEITKPSDYYLYENMFRITGKLQSSCEEDEEDDNTEDCNIPIEMLDNDKFYIRCNTHIKLLKPSFNKPISKMVGNRIEFKPQDLGSVALEYIRFPKFGTIKTIVDPQYNDEIADPATSDNYEWDEGVRELLVWFITDTFSIHTREQALKQHNQLTGKTAKG